MASEDDFLSETWIQWLCSTRENDFLCEVDASYIEDGFNLYGLRAIIPNFRECLEQILDCGSDSDPEPEEWSGNLFPHARNLYGLIHSRFILTSKGMSLMATKYHGKDFGVCPRVYCGRQPVLPVGLSDELGNSSVKVFCPSCQDVFQPTDSHAAKCDGAYFGSTFPHLFLMVKPQPIRAPSQVYVPRIYGFKIFHPSHLKHKTIADARGAGAGAGAGAGDGAGADEDGDARLEESDVDGKKKRKNRRT